MLATATAVPARCGGFTSRPSGHVSTNAPPTAPMPKSKAATPHRGSPPAVRANVTQSAKRQTESTV